MCALRLSYFVSASRLECIRIIITCFAIVIPALLYNSACATRGCVSAERRTQSASHSRLQAQVIDVILLVRRCEPREWQRARRQGVQYTCLQPAVMPS